MKGGASMSDFVEALVHFPTVQPAYGGGYVGKDGISIFGRKPATFKGVQFMALPDFGKIVTDALALKDAIVALDGPGSLDGLSALAADAANVWRYFQQPNMLATVQGNADLAKAIACCQDVMDAAAAAQVPVMAAGPVGAWGDGTILKLILAAMPDIIAALKLIFGG